ncbi:MAG: DUF47 family protein [Desulfurococcaceae archaeon]
MATWFWLAKSREKRVIHDSIRHLTKIREVAEDLNNMINNIYVNDKLKAIDFYNKLDKDEKDADEIKRNIIKELSTSTLHPMDREDLLKLIFTSDDIAAFLKACSHKLKILLDIQIKIDKEIINRISEVELMIIKQIELLIDSLENLYRDISTTLTYTNLVEEIEEKIDMLKMELQEAIYSKCETITIRCLLLKEAIEDIEMASDKCEDVADIIRMIATTYS